MNLPALNTLRVVSWDVDGTLYSLPHLIKDLRRRYFLSFLKRGGGVYRNDVMRARKWLKQVDLARTEQRFPAQETFGSAPLSNMLEPSLSRLGCAPAVRELIAAFAQAGLTQVVFSDFEAVQKVRALNLSQHFSAVLSAEAHSVLKPSPKPLAHWLTQQNIAPEATLHIGDKDDHDGALARTLGCHYWPAARLAELLSWVSSFQSRR